ncbi:MULTISPECIES: hypothetical protein [Gulbenkiania]|uniref:Uncharacterized protein n=2 Tax=Gulbenkiania TaxID=397456 RepID=A0A0K6GVF8_9NEIS|nr:MULTISPECIES: hypothetical protein [Gulbenkiania]TCW30742.1 hypothetical protein EV669_10668 [Gulbenkiania mobilis]CUA82736.1 hypothetical protein Ga0061063_1432 [Gulbenkiania indica]
MTTLKDFSQLLQAARQQSSPQRLLFVFVDAVLPEDATPEERLHFERGEGGVLEPMLCVDKHPDEVGDFDALREESEATGQPWLMVFVAALSGKGSEPPSAEEVDQALKRMVQTVRTGGDISRYVAFGRDGEPVRFY